MEETACGQAESWLAQEVEVLKDGMEYIWETTAHETGNVGRVGFSSEGNEEPLNDSK